MTILHKKGFTLIEVIIYIALFSLLMGSAFVTAFQLIDGSREINMKNTREEEGNFVMRKFDRVLTGISSFTNTMNTLHVNRYDGNQIDIQLVGTKIKITESMGLSDFLTTDNVSVDSLQFTYITPSGSGPAGITATTIINGMTFTITKYIRQ